MNNMKEYKTNQDYLYYIEKNQSFVSISDYKSCYLLKEF